jgi:hypothetical protein
LTRAAPSTSGAAKSKFLSANVKSLLLQPIAFLEYELETLGA